MLFIPSIALRATIAPGSRYGVAFVFDNGWHAAHLRQPAYLRELGSYCLNGQTHRQNHVRSPTRQVWAQWQVVGTYPDGQQEHITGFKTEVDALDWIANGRMGFTSVRS